LQNLGCKINAFREDQLRDVLSNAQTVSDWKVSNDKMVSYQLSTNGNPKTGVTRVTFKSDYTADKCVLFKYKAKTGDTMYTDFLLVPKKGTAVSTDPAYGQDFGVEVETQKDMSSCTSGADKPKG
jgi:hypothetical protein